MDFVWDGKKKDVSPSELHVVQQPRRARNTAWDMEVVHKIHSLVVFLREVADRIAFRRY